MAKILKNQTGSIISIRDVGAIPLAASPTQYVIPPQDFGLWAASTDIDPYITAGTVIVNDGYEDLKPQTGLLHIHEESVPRASAYNASRTYQAAANTTITLTASSKLLHIFTGAVAGQIIKLPNATTLNTGHRYEFWSKDAASLTVKYNDNTTLTGVGATQRTTITLVDNTTTNGVWVADSNFSGGGGSGTDLDTKQFGRQGTISNNTVLLTLNNVLGDTSPDVAAYDYYFRRMAWSNSNNAAAFNIRLWRINGDMNPASKVILYDYLTTGGRTGYMNIDINSTIDTGQAFYIEVTTTGSPRPADLNVIVSLRQR